MGKVYWSVIMDDSDIRGNSELRSDKWAQEIKNKNDASNFIAKILNNVGWIIVVLGVLGGFFYGGSLFYFIFSVATGLVTGLLFVGFAEVINLLNEIKENTKKTVEIKQDE
jgi:hypothetical protein